MTVQIVPIRSPEPDPEAARKRPRPEAKEQSDETASPLDAIGSCRKRQTPARAAMAARHPPDVGPPRRQSVLRHPGLARPRLTPPDPQAARARTLPRAGGLHDPRARTLAKRCAAARKSTRSPPRTAVRPRPPTGSRAAVPPCPMPAAGTSRPRPNPGRGEVSARSRRIGRARPGTATCPARRNKARPRTAIAVSGLCNPCKSLTDHATAGRLSPLSICIFPGGGAPQM